MKGIRQFVVDKIFEDTCAVENMDYKFGRTLNDKENKIRIFILSQTPVLGFIPQKGELLSNFKFLNEKELNKILLKFNKLDIIHLSDNNFTISAAYPFSNSRTKHQIKFSSEKYKPVYAMCAIDALGISFMLKTDLIIESVCHYSNQKIMIRLNDQQITKTNPEDIAVWYDMDLSCCAAVNQCNNLNFFSSKENFYRWEKLNGKREGYLLNIDETLYLGSLFFNNRLNWTK